MVSRPAFGADQSAGMIRLGHGFLLLMFCVMLQALTGAIVSASSTTQTVPAFTVASQGQAACAIVIAPPADPDITQHARTLAQYLQKITGASFEVQVGDGSTGIALGTAADFKGVDLPAELTKGDALSRETYLIRSHAQGVRLVGATSLAVRHATWDLLEQLGYRQYFPGKTWEVIPSVSHAIIQADRLESPSFQTRHIWYGFGLWRNVNEQPYEDWCVRNRANAGFQLGTAHAYQTIIRQNKGVFDEHPEYLGLVNGKRQGTKFCISNADLRKLVIDQYVLPFFEKYPERDSISLEPSDGGGWCECESCARLGSISDRVTLLANEAAVVLQQKYPGKYVGLLAYNEHCAPPNIRVEPNVVVKVQTGFIRGGLTFEQIVTGWRARGAMVGMGDYYSVFLSDMSRPASQKGSDLIAITHTLKQSYDLGARFFMAESSDLWGAIGLGHYVAARLAWDITQADDVQAIERDFFERAFGPAREPMEAFYRLTYRARPGDRRPLIRRDMLGRMYRYLQQAVELAKDDPAVLARIHDLAVFTRYEDLFQTYDQASGKDRQQAFETLMSHVWKIRHTMMVHGKPITNNQAARFISKDRQITALSKGFAWPEETYSAQEIHQIIEAGVASTELVELGFEPVDFSDDLIPATALKLPPTPADQLGVYNRVAPQGRQRFFTWLDRPGRISLTISGGHIVHYRNIASPVQTTIYARANPMVGEPVASDKSVPPDGSLNTVHLDSPFEGLHQVEVYPPSNRAMVVPHTEGTPWVMACTLSDANTLSGSWDMYFYVPRGTAIVGGFASNGRGRILDSKGKVVMNLSQNFEAPGFFKVDVPAGEAGKLWKLQGVAGKLSLLTVPPYLARSAQELMLPREVVEADRQ